MYIPMERLHTQMKNGLYARTWELPHRDGKKKIFHAVRAQIISALGEILGRGE